MPSPETSPRPWRVMRFSAEDEPDRIIDANGDEVAIELLEADAALIVQAVNNADSWIDAYIKARTERNAFLLERDRLRDIVRRLITIRENLFWRKDGRTGLISYCMTIDEDDARRTMEEARAAIGEDAR